MCFGVARWSLGGARSPRGLPGGCSMVIGYEIEVFGSLRKSVFDPLASLEVVFMGSSLHYNE